MARSADIPVVVSTARTDPWAAPSWDAPDVRRRAADALTAVVVAAVEEQLSGQVRDAVAQLAEARRAGAESRAALRAELVTLLDERAARLTSTHEAQLETVDARIGSLSRRADEQVAVLGRRLDDELAALAQRVGQQVASLEAELAATRSSVEAVTQRLAAIDERLDGLDEAVGRVDEEAIDELKRDVSRTVGEATLVRIELDRVSATSSERFDKVTVRMGEIEALLADDMDVSAAVQLERLDELERAIAEIDPGQFVRKDDADRRGDHDAHVQDSEPSRFG